MSKITKELFLTQLEHSVQYENDILLNNTEDYQAQRHLAVLNKIKKGICVNPGIILTFIHPEKASIGQTHFVDFTSPTIDETQGNAVQKALVMNDVLLIQGPPGAGKTTTIAEIIKQLRMKFKNSKILVTAQAHAAVDNVILKLDKDGFGKDLARIHLKKEVDAGEIKKFDEEHIFEYYRNSMDTDIYRFFEKKDYYEEDLVTRKESFIKFNRTNLIMSKDVIGITSNAIMFEQFGIKYPFDYVIVDEVGKLSFSELLVCASIAKKLILIGDPYQLPAVYQEIKKGDKENLEYLQDNSFIEALFENINPDCKCFLDRQYRMSNAIGKYISNEFYNHQLKNGLNRHIDDALVSIDYNVCGHEVRNMFGKESATSGIRNEYEVEIILHLLNHELKNVDGSQIAIITPYKDQLRLIKNKVTRVPIRNIDTVDAFQGREAKIVIFSCVRNYGKPTLFFKKKNRINVAISRAIDKVIVIGARDYIRQVDFLKNYLEFDEILEGKRNKCKKYFYQNNTIFEK